VSLLFQAEVSYLSLAIFLLKTFAALAPPFSVVLFQIFVFPCFPLRIFFLLAALT